VFCVLFFGFCGLKFRVCGFELRWDYVSHNIAVKSQLSSIALRATAGLGFGVWGLGFGIWGLGFGVWGLGFGVWGLGFWGLGFWGWGLGLGFSVLRLDMSCSVESLTSPTNSYNSAEMSRATPNVNHHHHHQSSPNATAAHDLVTRLTRDVQELDVTKRNLTLAIEVSPATFSQPKSRINCSKPIPY